jgi:hypothetical protein
MGNSFEDPNAEKQIKEIPIETNEIGKKEGMESEIDPELLESIQQQIEKEREETKKPVSLFPKKLQKFMATALLGLTIGSGVMAREAQAGQIDISRQRDRKRHEDAERRGRNCGI